jgi:hypothetical protein
MAEWHDVARRFAITATNGTSRAVSSWGSPRSWPAARALRAQIRARHPGHLRYRRARLGAHRGRAARQDLGRRDSRPWRPSIAIWCSGSSRPSGWRVIPCRPARACGPTPIASARAVRPAPARVSRRGDHALPELPRALHGGPRVARRGVRVPVYLLVEQVINRMSADLAAGQSICFLMPGYLAGTALERCG